MEGGIQTAPMEQWKNIVKTQEVHPTQVGDFVRQGWVILIAYMRRIDIPHQEFQNSYVANTTKQVYEPIIVMGQTNVESMMAELNDAKTELNRLRPITVDLTKERDTLKRENTALTDTAKVLADSKTALLSDAVAWRTRHETLDVVKTKLESDIGKLRRALGDLRMKEILEGA